MSNKSRIVFFLGYMGSGKSTIGKVIANNNSWNQVDLDDLIEENESKTISQIFDDHGEGYFRSLETSMLRSLDFTSDTIVCLGGGTPCFNDNMDYIKQKGESIWFYVDPITIVDRLKKDTERPLLQNKTEEELLTFVSQHSEDREAYYSQADHIIDASECIEDIVAKIENIIK